ncbi:MAG: S-layer homology domain-containing protein, partial [bacterium]|nr:S-layer homology domain-containing protein [bacterium]
SLLGLLFIGVTIAAEPVIKLYDQVLTLPGCSLTGSDSCALLDGDGQQSVLKKTVRLQRFVPGGGYLSVFFRDQDERSNEHGGFVPDTLFFQRLSGERVELRDGLQVFERGNLVAEFDQPYTSSHREQINYEFVFYYLPHSEQEKQRLLLLIQDDEQDFSTYKRQSERDIQPLCTAVRGQPRTPYGCAGGTSTGSGTASQTSPGDFVSNPAELPELDFSGKASRAPELTIRDDERLVFIGQPVMLHLDQVVDPDGKCGFFKFEWKKPASLQASDVSVDPRLGDLSFTPLNEGSFTIRVRAEEVCGAVVGNKVSPFSNVRVIVNDKATAFSDLRYAPGLQGYVYDLYHLGVMKGYSDGTMRPNAAINRAEFLKMIFETLKYNIGDQVYSPRYPDVLPTHWFAKYVHQADVLGVVKGYADGRFHPSRTVNLAEALKMAMHFTTIEIKDSLEFLFGDVDYRDWYSRYVQTAYREGILEDIQPGSNVFPGQPLTRAKAAQIIVRTLLHPVNRINQANKDVLRRVDEFQDFSTWNPQN